MGEYKISEEELAEEEEVIKMLDSGEFKNVPNVKEEIKKAMIAAKNFQSQNKKVSDIGVKADDLNKIKLVAAKRGISYKMLISSMLHDATRRLAA